MSAAATTSKLAHALAHAGKGFFVFPLTPDAKTPVIKDFPSQATNDPETIQQWWAQRPDANIGIYTGRYGDQGGHLFVIDVDVKDGKPGVDTLARLEDEHGGMQTLEAETPSGGKHLYFVTDSPTRNTTQKLGTGIDTRGVGGYVVAPGSVVGGKVYRWRGECREPAPAPSWAVQRVGAPREKGSEIADALGDMLDDPALLGRAADFLASNAPPAIEGDGGDAQTYQVACRVKDIGISELACLELMDTHYNPRCQPSWDYDAIAVKVSNAYGYGKNAIGNDVPDFDPVDVPAAETATNDFAKTISGKRLRFRFADGIRASRSTPYLVRNLLDRGSFSVLYGESNGGKSFVALHLGYCVAANRRWCGQQVRGGPVVYAALEGAGVWFDRRIEALVSKYGAHGAERLAIADGVLDMRSEQDRDELVGLCQEVATASGQPVQSVFVDTLSRALGSGQEKEAADMMAFLAGVADVQRRTGHPNVTAIHHPGKQEDRGMRGSYALLAAADTVLKLSKRGATNAGGFDVEIVAEKQRDQELRNFGLKLRKVHLYEDDEGQSVQTLVVDESVMDPVDDIEQRWLAALRTLEVDKPYRESSASPDWVGHRLAEAMGLRTRGADDEAKRNKDHIKSLIREALAAGYLRKHDKAEGIMNDGEGHAVPAITRTGKTLFGG